MDEARSQLRYPLIQLDILLIKLQPALLVKRFCSLLGDFVAMLINL
jgi:hypothetical protein